MRTYRETIGKLHKDHFRREPEEWSNGWYDAANIRENGKRILFIGDCILRQSRSGVSRNLKCPIDLFGTSSALDDELFALQIDSFFQGIDYMYDVAVIQVGHHANLEPDGSLLSTDSLRNFETNLTLLCDFISQYAPKILLLTVLKQIRPVEKTKLNRWKLKHGFMKEKPDEVMNIVVNAKNEIIERTAKKHPATSFYNVVEALEKTKFLHRDHVHYEDKALPFIVKEISEAIKRI